MFRKAGVWPRLSLYRANEHALSVTSSRRLSKNPIDYLAQDPGVRNRWNPLCCGSRRMTWWRWLRTRDYEIALASCLVPRPVPKQCVGSPKITLLTLGPRLIAAILRIGPRMTQASGLGHKAKRAGTRLVPAIEQLVDVPCLNALRCDDAPHKRRTGATPTPKCWINADV